MKNKLTPLKIFNKAIAPHRALTAALLALIAVNVAVSLLPPLILGVIVDQLTGQHPSRSLLGAGLVYFAVLLASKLLEAVRESMITVWGEKVTHGIRTEMAQKLSRLPASYFSHNSSGTLVSRFVNDVDTLEDLFSSGIISMIANLASIIGILAVVFVKSLGLGLLLLLSLPILWWFTVLIQRASYKAQLDNRQAVAACDQVLPETLRNLLMIRLYQAEKFMRDHYQKILRRSFAAMERSNFCDAVYSPVVIFAQALLTAVMMVCASLGGGFRGFFGISAGTAVTVIAYVGQVFTPLADIGMEIQNVQAAMAGTKRIEDFMNEAERPASQKQVLVQTPAIAIKDLSFAYEPGRPIFDHFNLTVNAGEIVTLKGRTGAGKSTLFKLILGLYQPQAGQIKIFGQDVAALPEAEKRQLYGCVEQNFKPVAGCLLEQISLGDPGIGEDQVWQALETVGLAERVRKLPAGLDSSLSSAALSNGQLQLLSIARAIVCQPKLLLFDEITANLDVVTEDKLLSALKRAARGNTLLSISHRTELLRGGKIITIGKDQ
jgi:ATP-binding cassette subfamily B multidrug efflux pump